MPKGLGALDELTEVVTLMQTHKIRPFPVILFDSGYWEGFLTWLRNPVLSRNYISEVDYDMLRVCDDPTEVADSVNRWSGRQPLVARSY